MTSYKLYNIKPDFKIESYFSNNWKDDLQLPKGTSENIRRKFDEVQKDIKNTLLNKTREKVVLKCDYRLNFGTQEVWVPKSIDIIKYDNLILIQKLSSQIEMVIEKTLGNNIIPYTFMGKDLLKLWYKLKKATEENSKQLFLHRLILSKTFLEADEIDELNICSKDVSKLDYFKTLTKSAKKIKVITIRLKGLTEMNKIFTVRIAQNQLQIYGNHLTKTIIEFLKYLK